MADLVQTAANVVSGAGATVREAIAEASITAGQPVYADASSTPPGKLQPAEGADSITQVSVVGIALNSAAVGQPVVYQTAGQINLGATLQVGHEYFVSTNTGGIMPQTDLTSGDWSFRLGTAISTSLLQLDLDPNPIQWP